MASEQHDLVIIGGGPGGYAAALYGAAAGLDVAMIENRRIGGTCLNRGCIPAKELLQTAEVARTVRESDRFGVNATGDITLEDVPLPANALGYTGVGLSKMRISNRAETDARIILIGGEPFDEEILMWWNFIGRTHEEIAQYREEWQAEGDRFGAVEGYVGKGGPGENADGLSRLPAPRLPDVRIKARKNPPPHVQS